MIFPLWFLWSRSIYWLVLALLKTFSWQELRHHPWRSASAVVAVLLGVALAFRHGAMLGVDFLRTLLAAPAQRVLAWVVGVICMGFLGMLAWVGGQMVWRVRFQTLPSLEISISWVYLAIPVGASLAAIAVLARLLDRAAVTELRNDAQG